MLNMQTKQMIDLEYKNGQQDEDIGTKATKYEICYVNKTSNACGKR